MDYIPNPNINPNTISGPFCERFSSEYSPPPPSSECFQLSDYLSFQDCLFKEDDDHDQNMSMAFNESSLENMSSKESNTLAQSDDDPHSSRPTKIRCISGSMKRNMVDEGLRIAFRTQSKLDIMDDGFKWRKYGKKMVKNNPNPRNYFKCSSGGCNVKKQVERDRCDSSFVITTYDGIHNHESPSVIYYNPSTLIPNEWSLQHQQHTFSSSPSI